MTISPLNCMNAEIFKVNIHIVRPFSCEMLDFLRFCFNKARLASLKPGLFFVI
jgi:hypothetical protein